MAEYETKQRRILLDYLNAHPDRGFSVEELFDGLSMEHAADIVPGKSTLYRLIARHVRYGRTPQAAQDWVEYTDEPNARLIEASRSGADVIFRWEE